MDQSSTADDELRGQSILHSETLLCVGQASGLDTAMRYAIIELILGTDMTQHFALVSRLQVTHAYPYPAIPLLPNFLLDLQSRPYASRFA